MKYLRLYLLIALLASVASAATFTVTKETDDDGPCTPDDCALREAILAANALPGADTVLVPPGTYPLTLTGPVPENQGFTGDLDIQDDLELLGDSGQPPVIIGDGTDRVIHILLSAVELSHLVITGGVGASSGGGLRASGDLTLRDSEIVGNSTLIFGGGLFFCCGSATIVDTTFENNTAQIEGGGIANFVVFLGQRTQLINSTVVGNHAPIGGGVMIVSLGAFDLINSTIADNTSVPGFGSGVALDGANSVRFSNTLLSNNTCGGFVGIPQMTNGHNMEGPSSTCFPPGNDQTGVTDLGLGPLGDHGGPTRTMPLLPDSPALDSALLTDCPMADQRGVRRPQGVGCDIGAFEREVTPVEIPALGPYELILLAGLLAVVGVFYVKQERRCLF